jgi:hypothetical protein
MQLPQLNFFAAACIWAIPTASFYPFSVRNRKYSKDKKDKKGNNKKATTTAKTRKTAKTMMKTKIRRQ